MFKAKSILKRTLAALLVLMTVMSVGVTTIVAATVDMIDTGAIADTGVPINAGDRIWFYNSGNWNTVKIHLWGGTSNETKWPGNEMQQDAATGFYYWDSDGNYKNCIFNDGGNTQTKDLTTVGAGYLYNYKDGKWVEPTTVGAESTYKLKGEFNNWSDTDNIMSYVDTVGTVSESITLQAGNYKFKIHGDAWYGKDDCNITDTCENLELSSSGNDINLKITESGTYTFTFSTISKKLTVTKYVVPTVTVTVNEELNPNFGTVTIGDSVDSNVTVNKDSSVSYTVSVSDADKYYIESITVGDQTVAIGDKPTQYTGSFVASADTVLKVKYNVHMYDVTFNYDDNTETKQVEHGATVTAPACDKEGYDFLGWSTDGTEANIVADFASKTFTEDAEFTAVYRIKSYTVVFMNGDSQHDSQTVNYNSSATLPEPPVLDGYTFSGWSTESGSTTTVNVETYLVKADTTFYAVFAINSYSVNFIAKDGTTSVGTDNVDYKDKATAPDAPAVPGWTFSHWSLTQGGEAVEVATHEITANTTFYAVYTEDTYTVSVTQNVNGGTASASPTSVKYNDEVILTATAELTNGYEFSNWTIVGSYSYKDGSSDTSESATIIVTGDVTVTPNFKLKEYSVNVSYNAITGSTASAVASDSSVSHGETVTLTATEDATNGVVFEGWSIEGTYEPADADLSALELTITVKSDITATASFTQLDKFNYTVTTNIEGGGVVVPESGSVFDGNSVTVTVTPNTGYTFTNWSIVSDSAYTVTGGNVDNTSVTVVPQADISFVANFTANSGTVNVSAGNGGSVNNDGGAVTYPNKVSATATATTDGYVFTHWTVTSDGTKGTDYLVTENDNQIEVTVLTQDTVVNVVANFANAQSVTLYTYSENGFKKLNLTEAKGDLTNTVYNNTQTSTSFGNETWYTSGDLSLTAGYNTITAKLYDDNPLVGGTGNLVMFKDTLNWGSVYLYADSQTLYAKDRYDKITQDGCVSTKNLPAIEMKPIGNGYYYAYTSNSTKYIAFSKHNQGDYDWLYNTSASYPTNGTVTGSYSSNTPVFEPDSSTNWNTNNTDYHNNGTWSAIPVVSTETSTIDISAALYDGNRWLGNDEVWLYFDATGNNYVATNRRQLNDYVTSSIIVSTYNNGVKDKEYTAESWSAFTTAYTNAKAALGTGASTQTEIDTAYSTLNTAFQGLALDENVALTGSHGAEPYTDQDKYFGKISFKDITTTSNTGNIGDNNYYHYTCEYLTATIERGTIVTVQTQLESDYISDYLVYGWVINGTDFVEATEDIDTKGLYVGTYKCSNAATFVPVYFRKTTVNNWEENENIVKIYANTAGASENWGNYISAYTWYSGLQYYQFGHWTGQVMIPDVSNPGMYYTFVEKSSPTNQAVTGIAFTNYGGNTGVNSSPRYQTYDYYEFIELANQEFDNIVFDLNTKEENANAPKTDNINISDYDFEELRDFSGNKIDISREKLNAEDAEKSASLYIVRTGPIKYNDVDGAGAGWGTLDGSDYYVDSYIYDSNGTYLGRCKTYELLNLEKLNETRKIDLTAYTDAPVMVDYASLTESKGNNKRYDGEWYGTKYGLTNVTISAKVAFMNDDNTVTNYDSNVVDTVGAAYVNGEASVAVSHGSEGHIISATPKNNNDFVGWYRATVADDDTYTIDTTVDPLFTEISNVIDASADALYVAVFKAHPAGSFTVNNYYYTFDDFRGQTISPYAPPVFGNDTNYSIRDVKIEKIYDEQGDDSTLTDLGRAGTYSQTIENISAGDKLRITIYTKPTYTRDYVYAWYIQADDSNGVNFEEIGTNELQDNKSGGVEKSFTFDYEVKEGVSNITVYSDVVHITPQVTLTYIYNNRYNQEKKYIVNYTLTDDEIQNGYAPSDNTISANAPVVGDLYKNVEWVVDDTQSDATNWTLRARESDIFTVTFHVGAVTAERKGRYNTSISLYAKDIASDVTEMGLWYIDKNTNSQYDSDTDTIVSYGQYFGLVITEDVDVYYETDVETVNKIVLAEAVYGAEKATDENGNITTNKVYVDYLISYLLNIYSGDYIDLNGNNIKDDNEPSVKDLDNTNSPVSIDAIEKAGYKVKYGLVLELVNTFNASTKDAMIEKHFGKNITMTDKITDMLQANASNTTGQFSSGTTGYSGETYFYGYDSKLLGSVATNKNRVLMTFGYNNTESNRNRYYNVVAYLTISDSNGENTMYLYSNQATLNIKEADNIQG